MNSPNIFEVSQFHNKFRLGRNADGGYVIGELKTNYDCYISAGVSTEESFTRDFIQRYNPGKNNTFAFDGTIDNYPYEYTTEIQFIKKNIGGYNDAHITDLRFLIDQYNDIFLKMDIEGGEYPWLLSLETYHINKFSQIVIEFHGIMDDSWGARFEDKIKCFKKLLSTHYIIHAHGNNFGDVINGYPCTIELTYVNKKHFMYPPPKNYVNLPIAGVDFPNSGNDTPDIQLNFYPFTSPYILPSRTLPIERVLRINRSGRIKLN
jgi:hypothetical protein